MEDHRNHLLPVVTLGLVVEIIFVLAKRNEQKIELS